MQRKRRSGRIAKEIAIVLLGTDATGKVFSEETKTVVLSRHGAGVVTRYRFSPDELLTLRLPGSDKEAAIRLVGQIGGEPGRYVYGVTFVDPDPDFWPMEFPPPDPLAPASREIALECSMCQTRQEMEQGDIEEDVYSVNGNILRYCAECGTSTPWKKAEGEAFPTPSTSEDVIRFARALAYIAFRGGAQQRRSHFVRAHGQTNFQVASALACTAHHQASSGRASAWVRRVLRACAHRCT